MPDELTATQRGAIIVHLLHVEPGGWTVAELAAKLGIDERCAKRAVDLISCCNIPIYEEKGRLKLLKN